MRKTANQKARVWRAHESGQAAVELAVFGAILIFILGTIVRTAVSNGYEQNENFKAMRLALLSSWEGSEARTGKGASAVTARDSASVLFVEDRLSPDFNKYGDLDRNPYIVQGAGTMNFNMFYPISNSTDILNALPIMDVYINGQHFPFTTAAYTSQTIVRPASCPYAPGSCLQNQCLRNEREWVGGIITASQFDNVIPVGTINTQTDTVMANNAQAIYQALVSQGYVITSTGSASVTTGYVNPSFTAMPSTFTITNPGSGQSLVLNSGEIAIIQGILMTNKNQYKLFYTRVVNGTPQFSPTAPASCSGVDNALCSTLATVDAFGNPFTNTNADMQYDLERLGDYSNTTGVESPAQFPYVTTCSSPLLATNMRCYIQWQWAASPGTTADAIGLDASSNQYPTYDIDGRLKEVTIYAISQNADGTPYVTYEDYQGGDIDTSWDSNSCGPKPGLQSQAQVFTFTQQGTYLLMQEGKLYDPGTGQEVRSSNKRNTIDLIQRQIQLSNNTGRFCNPAVQSETGAILPTVANDGVTPNPVEVCIYPGDSNNCFSTENNIKSTCYDENSNIIFVRSRLQDLRGHLWITDASGQLNVH